MALHNPPHPGVVYFAVVSGAERPSAAARLGGQVGVAASTLNRVLTGASGNQARDGASARQEAYGRSPESWPRDEYKLRPLAGEAAPVDLSCGRQEVRLTLPDELEPEVLGRLRIFVGRDDP